MGNKVLTVLGTMSGTSLDGVDVALLRTDGQTFLEAGPTAFWPYREAERDVLQVAFKDGAKLQERTARPAVLAKGEDIVTHAHILALKDFLKGQSLSVDFIGFHGQTIFHAPARHMTVQLGKAHQIAKALGIPVVYDFRQNDILHGGEGAPLAPVFHKTIVSASAVAKPSVFLNLGGVANITFISDEHDLMAFDTGPANALIDDYMFAYFNKPMDEGGQLAAQGRVDENVLQFLLAQPYFNQKPPKSLDRKHFHEITFKSLADLSHVDALATLTAFTARAIAKGLSFLAQPPKSLIVSGGGVKNPVLLRYIKAHTGLEPQPSSCLGWDERFIEAYAFAYLTALSVNGLPFSFPGTTGVFAPLSGGVLASP